MHTMVFHNIAMG